LEIRRQRWVYGITVTSDSALQPNGTIRYIAAAHWGVVQYENTESLIDEQTGYITGSRTTGWAMRRFKQESDEGLEIARKYTAPEEEPYRALYRFRRIPIYAVEKRLLKQFAEFYRDAARETAPYEVTKICLPNGQSQVVATADPNYVRPMFAIAERSYRTTFASTPNPEGATDEPLPPLMMGEELDTQKSIQILPSPETTGAVEVEAAFDARSEVDLFKEFNSSFSAQNGNFNEIAVQKTFGTNQGRPGAAQRRPNLFEKEEPEPENGDNAAAKQAQNNNPNQIEYIVCSPGHSPNQANDGSIDATHATTLGQAIQHAKAEMKVQDIQGSVNFSSRIPFNTAIRPLDRLKATVRGRNYDMRIVSLSQSVTVQGTIDGIPLLTSSGTDFTAGIDREIPLTVTPRVVPGTNPNNPTPPRPSGVLPGGVFVVVDDLELGDLNIPNARSRGRFYG
jgi:hypothetical protein